MMSTPSLLDSTRPAEKPAESRSTINAKVPDFSVVQLSEPPDSCIDHRTAHPSDDLRWMPVLRDGLGHRTVFLAAQSTADGRIIGRLPLALVSSPWFGRFLVSLPYINSAGIQAASKEVASRLIEQAVELARKWNCRFLEIRQTDAVQHPAIHGTRTDKVLMQLALPDSDAAFWEGLKSKVRSQIRKAERYSFEVAWGGEPLLDEFYSVFARNMRDLGTPVYGKSLFRAICRHFANDAEFCIVRSRRQPVAAALLVHGTTTTEVPSASALREFRSSNVNMLLYRHLIQRAIERGSSVFDFGRSTIDGPTYQFKKQWGAEPSPSVWHYHVLRGSMNDLRPDQSGTRRLIECWKRLPVWLTRLVGPGIVRGIP